MRLEGKVALVTGGAGGIGSAICELFTREGAVVYVCDLHEQDGRALAERYTQQGKQVIYCALDVTDEASWAAVLERVAAEQGRLDILVNNAGISGSVPDRMYLSYLDKQWQVNARGVFLGMKQAHHLLPKRRSAYRSASVFPFFPVGRAARLTRCSNPEGEK